MPHLYGSNKFCVQRQLPVNQEGKQTKVKVCYDVTCKNLWRDTCLFTQKKDLLYRYGARMNKSRIDHDSLIKDT